LQAHNPFESSKWLLICLVLAGFTYFLGLDSRFAPKNGDEYPYTHIVRLTASSGNWLPLQSEMEGIKNTKPPLLFWQGIASTQNGESWSIFNLRWPSLVYTALTALIIGLVAGRIQKDASSGILASLIWLAFFNTYRYGRPFLAEPPEIFWLSLPFWVLLLNKENCFSSKWIFPIFAGICFGFANLYKSVAYLLPASSILLAWYWVWRSKKIFPIFKYDFLKIIIPALISLGLFSLWFLLDPNPEEIWKEFVIGENAGKFSPKNSNYFKELLWGGNSIGVLFLSGVSNAGLMFFIVINFFSKTIKNRKNLTQNEILLWIFIAILFVVFCLPSQRSGRYLLPAMPALAILMSFYWKDLSNWAFRLTLALNTVVIFAFFWLSLNINLWKYPPYYWVTLVTTTVFIVLGFYLKKFTKYSVLVTSLLTFNILSASLMPLEGDLGRFKDSTIQNLEGKTIWFPCDFRAKDEEYRFLLPGTNIKGYPVNDSQNLSKLQNQFQYFAVQTPFNADLELCEGCSIIGSRLEMKARHNENEIRSMLSGKVTENLFVKEYIVFSSFADPSKDKGSVDVCK